MSGRRLKNKPIMRWDGWTYVSMCRTLEVSKRPKKWPKICVFIFLQYPFQSFCALCFKQAKIIVFLVV
jgi:hypothetical protein